MTDTSEKRSYPYMPQQAWRDLRKRFVQSVPAKVTPDYIQSVLHVEESQARQHIGALKTLGLIDDEGRPMPLAHDWRSDDHYADACHTMVDRVYPQELRDAFPERDADRAAVQRWFLRNTGVGENAANKRALMFTMLQQADPNPPEPAAKTRPAKSEQSRHRQPRTPSNQPPRATADTVTLPVDGAAQAQVTPPAPVVSTQQNGMPSVHIDIQIHIAADAQLEQIDQVFASMAKHLYNQS